MPLWLLKSAGAPGPIVLINQDDTALDELLPISGFEASFTPAGDVMSSGNSCTNHVAIHSLHGSPPVSSVALPANVRLPRPSSNSDYATSGR